MTAQPVPPKGVHSSAQAELLQAQVHFRFRLHLLHSLAAKARLKFCVIEEFRTPEAQAVLYSKGRTTKGPIVTNARPWHSPHQYKLGADLRWFIPSGAPLRDTPINRALLLRLIAAAFLISGMTFTTIYDPWHVEHPGWRKFRDLLHSKPARKISQDPEKEIAITA